MTPDVLGPLLWLRQREIVHYARFKELFDYYQEKLNNGNNELLKQPNYAYNLNQDEMFMKNLGINNLFM